jgi:hypothetical protein
MEHRIKEQWLDLCAQAAICDDPERLKDLREKILAILEKEEERLERPDAQRKHFRVAP